jgi:hypothetical protein
MGLNERAVVNRVVAGGGRPDYVAKIFPSPPTAPPLPLVMIEETAPQPEEATKTLELVSKEMSPTLETIQLQAHVPPEMVVGAFVVTPPTEPIAAMPTRTRSTATIAVGGLALTVLVTVVTDILLAYRRRKPKAGRRKPKAAHLAASEDDQPAASPENTLSDELKPDSPDVCDADATDAAAAR